MMQPLGRTKINFPYKVKKWLGKGINMWWEDRKIHKKCERQKAKKQIESELSEG